MRVDELDELSELSDTTLELDELRDTTLELSELSDTENGDGLAAGRNWPYSVQGQVQKKSAIRVCLLPNSTSPFFGLFQTHSYQKNI